MIIGRQKAGGGVGSHANWIWQADEVLGPRPDLSWTTVGLAVMEQVILIVGRQMLVDGIPLQGPRVIPRQGSYSYKVSANSS